ncbi:hypothetical protein GCM10023068_42340 [Leifsonia shinshuensis]
MANWWPDPEGSSPCPAPIRRSSVRALSRSCVPASRPSRPLSNWIRQDDIDQGRRPGVPSSESAELRAAKGRIRELETELLIVRQAAKFLDEERPRPKGRFYASCQVMRARSSR